MSSHDVPFFWHHPILDTLLLSHRHQRLSHAHLISGPIGLAKTALARYFSQTLLCQNQSACGQCPSCRWLRADNHPDFHLLAPTSGMIRIDSIRTLSSFIQTSKSGPYKIALIEGADTMNTAAANSLLKILEEPPKDALILLLSGSPDRIPVTIRSRCQHWRLTLPPREQTAAWLQKKRSSPENAGNSLEQCHTLLMMANDSPFQALELARMDNVFQRRQLMADDWLNVVEKTLDPMVVAGRWMEWQPELRLRWLYSWQLDILRLHLNAPEITNIDLRPILTRMLSTVTPQTLIRRQNKLLQLLSLANTNVNSQLLLEDFLMDCCG